MNQEDFVVQGGTHIKRIFFNYYYLLFYILLKSLSTIITKSMLYIYLRSPATHVTINIQALISMYTLTLHVFISYNW